jgi:HEPN domain-containing protein
MSKLARAMWRQARHDLEHARRALRDGDHDWSTIAAQQAAEKALKATLLFAGLRAEPTHNLKGLFDALVAAGVATRDARAALSEHLAFLTMTFGFARYPMADVAEAPFDIITRKQAEHAISGAEAILAEARRLATELDA